MPTGGPFPTENAELNGYFNTVKPYIALNAARLNIDAGDVSELDTLLDNSTGTENEDGWEQLWVVYDDKAKVNTTIRNLIKVRKKEIQTLLRKIYGDLPKSQLTEQDRLTLNLPKRDSEPTTIQAVDFGPVISFEEIKNQIHILRFQNPETPDSNAMPPNQDVELQMYIGDAGIEDNDVPFAHFEDTGKHLFQVDHEPEDKGKTAYYRGRYETDTGKTGPWGDVQSEIIV
jgi:hypothetical protein